MIRDDITWGELEQDFYLWYDLTGQDEYLGYTLEEIQENDPDGLVLGEVNDDVQSD